MSQSLGTALWWATCVVLIGMGLRGIRELRLARDEAISAWQSEYQLRRCATLQAALANINSSVTYLSRLNPRFSQEISQVGTDLHQGLRRQYPQVSVGSVFDLCRSTLPLASFLKYQHQSGQARDWPNWVASFMSDDQGDQGGL